MLTESTFKNAKTALLIGAYFATKEKESCEENLKELERLCETYGLVSVLLIACPIKKFDAGTFLGSGKLEELLLKSDELGADVIVFDDEISPNQQRNLEELFKRPVIDRTELIIEVFAQRAQTSEARLQIELATVKYQLPRLKRMWTHLSRQAGSGGHADGGNQTKNRLAQPAHCNAASSSPSARAGRLMRWMASRFSNTSTLGNGCERASRSTFFARAAR